MKCFPDLLLLKMSELGFKPWSHFNYLLDYGDYSVRSIVLTFYDDGLTNNVFVKEILAKTCGATRFKSAPNSVFFFRMHWTFLDG